MSKKKKSKADGEDDRCLLCLKCDVDEFNYGKMIKAEGIQCHEFCLFFASGLHQEGDDDEGLCGFLVDDIRKEARRGQRLNCRYCRKKGATCGCVIDSCRVTFHFPCGLKNNTLHQFFNGYHSYCSNHRVQHQQYIPLKYRSGSNKECAICRESIHPKAPFYKELFTPCCQKWLHKDCVQRQAYSAGLFFFKCPLCNNSKEFKDEMNKLGIYVPERDACWELEQDAFRELEERYNQCDAEKCLCPDGRKHDENDDDSNWCIIVCELCASHGTHRKCGKVRDDQLQTWKCNVCVPDKKRENESTTSERSPKRIRTINNGPQKCDTENIDLNNRINNRCCEMDNCSYRTNESDSSDTEFKPIDLTSKNIGENGIECKNVRVNFDKIPLITID